MKLKKISQQHQSIFDICSRCLSHEVLSWIEDKRGKVDGEALKYIREELQTIRLKKGECLVCSNENVAEGTLARISAIFTENKVSKTVLEEFNGLFGLKPIK